MFFRKFALGMKKIVVTVCLLLCGAFAFAQRSYIMVNDATQDIEYLKEKSRQAGLDLGLTVLANRIPTDSKWVGPKPSKHLLKQGMLNLQRVFMIITAAAGIAVGYFGSSIVSIMEDVGAPAGAALVPIFCGIFFWGKKMNEKGTLITILVAVVATLVYWAVGSPIPGVSHFVFGLICSTMFR